MKLFESLSSGDVLLYHGQHPLHLRQLLLQRTGGRGVSTNRALARTAGGIERKQLPTAAVFRAPVSTGYWKGIRRISDCDRRLLVASHRRCCQRRQEPSSNAFSRSRTLVAERVSTGGYPPAEDAWNEEPAGSVGFWKSVPFATVRLTSSLPPLSYQTTPHSDRARTVAPTLSMPLWGCKNSTKVNPHRQMPRD